MKRTRLTKVLSLFLCIVLITAMAQMLGSCGKKSADIPSSAAETVAVGEGEHEFTLSVKHDGTEKVFTVKTDEKTVGAALTALGIIEGDEGEFGLYVKAVDGITADFEKDGTYWAFYVNGEYAMSGIDLTDITDGASYALSLEKG